MFFSSASCFFLQLHVFYSKWPGLDIQWNKNWERLGNCGENPILAKFPSQIMNQETVMQKSWLEVRWRKRMADMESRCLIVLSRRWKLMWPRRPSAGWTAVSGIGQLSAMQCTPRIRRGRRGCETAIAAKQHETDWDGGSQSAGGGAGGAARRLGGTIIIGPR